MTTATTNQQSGKPLKGTRTGVVVSDKRDKTRTVAIEHQSRHSKYGKFIHHTAKYHVHDEKNQSRVGDRVEIVNCRPISKTKSWRLVRVVVKGQGPEVVLPDAAVVSGVAEADGEAQE